MYPRLLFSNVDFHNDTIDHPTLALCFVIEIDKINFTKFKLEYTYINLFTLVQL